MIDKERLENMSPIGFDLNGDVLLKSEDYHWLMEQAERVEELEKKLSINTNNMKQLQKQNVRYKQALEFYADEESYEPLEVQIGAVTKEGYKISKYKYDPKINTDKGKKARETLGWEENK
jgi:hypothetical protein